MYGCIPPFLAVPPGSTRDTLDSGAGNIVCNYAQLVQLKFRNVQLKREIVQLNVNGYAVIFQNCLHTTQIDDVFDNILHDCIDCT